MPHTVDWMFLLKNDEYRLEVKFMLSVKEGRTGGGGEPNLNEPHKNHLEAYVFVDRDSNISYGTDTVNSMLINTFDPTAWVCQSTGHVRVFEHG